jgi:hypothetical protein
LTIPLSELGDSIEYTLRLIDREILERLQGRGWSIHTGIPTPARLPKEPEQVWYAPLNMRKDRGNSTFQGESYVSTWAIHCILLDGHPETYQTDYGPLYRHVGKTVEAITSTVANKGLDGAIDWGEADPVEFFEAEPAAGEDHGVIGAVVTLEAHHPLWCVRTS